MDATLGDSAYQPSNVSTLVYLDVHVIVVDSRRLLERGIENFYFFTFDQKHLK